MPNHTFSPRRKRSFFDSLSVTALLIYSNIIFFILAFAFGFFSSTDCSQTICQYVALIPANIFTKGYIWTFLTSMFMHGGLAHIIFNMVSLFFVGTLTERIIGRKRYFWFYIAAGVFAGIVFVSLAQLFGGSLIGAKLFGSPTVAGVGASGAIFGLLGVLAVLIPRKKISLIIGPLLAIILQYSISSFLSASISSLISIILSVYIFFSIFAIFSYNPRMIQLTLPLTMPFWLLPLVAIVPLVVAGLLVTLPIANSAHFGGLIAGIIYGFYLRKKYKRKTRYISRYFN